MKLYLFAIGGTGSRVLKSLTMLLASGVKLKTSGGTPVDKVVPYIIDFDVSLGDYARTDNLISNYYYVRQECSTDSDRKNDFFSTKIEKPVLIQLEGSKKEFKKFIALGDDMSKPNKALTNMLFSNDNLDTKMTEGFLGNPNIGSVALNQFDKMKSFKDFCSDFQDGDRVFIISSIFGGTGASGFPLLVKTLRNLSSDYSKADLIKKSFIGAISVLPYFNVEVDESSKIDSSTFISKTKAALNYYKDNLGQADLLYMVADRNATVYKNHQGGSSQKNKAHIVEFIAALSVIDFVSLSEDELKSLRESGNGLQVKEFGIKNIDDNLNELIFDNLALDIQELVKPQMTRYKLFQMYLNDKIESSANQTWSKDLEFDKHFYSSSFYKALIEFNKALIEWYEEMGEQERKFVPFVLNYSDEDLFHFVKGVEPIKIRWNPNCNYDLYNQYLDQESKNISKVTKKEIRFMDLFYRVTKSLVSKKLNIE